MLRYLLYFPQHLLQVDFAEHGIHATFTDTGSDSV
jgi:hypothetical protein